MAVLGLGWQMQRLNRGEAARTYKERQGTCDVAGGVTLNYYVYAFPAEAAAAIAAVEIASSASRVPESAPKQEAVSTESAPKPDAERVLMIMGRS